MCCDDIYLFIGPDAQVSYLGAKNPDGEFLNSGTCTYSLKDVTETEIDAGTVDYVAESDGNYLGTIDGSVTATLVDGDTYYIDLSFASGAFDDRRRLTKVAAYRGGS